MKKYKLYIRGAWSQKLLRSWPVGPAAASAAPSFPLREEEGAARNRSAQGSSRRSLGPIGPWPVRIPLNGLEALE